MKKIIFSAIVVSLTTILFSCRKQADLQMSSSSLEPVKQEQEIAGRIVPVPPQRVPFTISNWFGVPLSHINSDDGSVDPFNLFGKYVLKTPLIGATDTDVKLAYVRMPSPDFRSDSYTFYQLPGDVQIRDRFLVNMSFNLTASQFDLTVTGIGIIAFVLDPKDFEHCAYRYIVISKADYDGLNIDWSNYKVVASTLNFAP